MATRYSGPISHKEYVQRVRRHKPTSLLPLVAENASKYGGPDGEWKHSPYLKVTPWALSDVARVSLTCGNELRKDATEQDVIDCCAAHQSVIDPRSLRPASDPKSLEQFMVRIAYEQFQYQGSVYAEFGRTLAIYEQTSPTVPMQVLHGDWQVRMLECKLADYCAAAFILHMSALSNAGTFSIASLSQSEYAEVVEAVPIDTLTAILTRSFIATVSEFRQLQDSHDQRLAVQPTVRRFTFNALQDKPVIEGVAQNCIIPSPRLLINKVSCLGLFHSGIQTFGKPFADDTGNLFEQYIGRTLKLIPDVKVIPEIEYGPKGERKKTVDWIVVHERVVLLVEVKARRPAESIRLGTEEAQQSIRKSIADAVSQISITAVRMAEGEQALGEIPRDRPVVGIVITMEPFYYSNSPIYPGLLDQTQVPAIVMSSAELEHLSCVVSSPPVHIVLDNISDIEAGQWSFESAMEGVEMRHNPVLDAAWNALPWR